jgi:hypothetical protein
VISIAIAIVLTFLIGISMLRQTHAIWEMDSPNAVSFNSTLNLAFGTGYSVELIVFVVAAVIIAVVLMSSVRLGF